MASKNRAFLRLNARFFAHALLAGFTFLFVTPFGDSAPNDLSVSEPDILMMTGYGNPAFDGRRRIPTAIFLVEFSDPSERFTFHQTQPMPMAVKRYHANRVWADVFPSVPGFFRSNSNNQFQIVPLFSALPSSPMLTGAAAEEASVFGPFSVEDNPETRYLNEAASNRCAHNILEAGGFSIDMPRHEFQNFACDETNLSAAPAAEAGQVENERVNYLTRFALSKIERELNRRYGTSLNRLDRNRDGILTNDEFLLIYVNAGANTFGGAVRGTGGPVRFPNTNGGFTTYDGSLGMIGEASSLGVIAHEFSHLLGTYDVYGPGYGPLFNGALTNMSTEHTDLQIDSVNRTKVSWEQPRIFDIDQEPEGCVLIAPRLAPASQSPDTKRTVILFNRQFNPQMQEYLTIEARSGDSLGGDSAYDRKVSDADSSPNGRRGINVWWANQEVNPDTSVLRHGGLPALRKVLVWPKAVPSTVTEAAVRTNLLTPRGDDQWMSLPNLEINSLFIRGAVLAGPNSVIETVSSKNSSHFRMVALLSLTPNQSSLGDPMEFSGDDKLWTHAHGEIPVMFPRQTPRTPVLQPTFYLKTSTILPGTQDWAIRWRHTQGMLTEAEIQIKPADERACWRMTDRPQTSGTPNLPSIIPNPSGPVRPYPFVLAPAILRGRMAAEFELKRFAMSSPAAAKLRPSSNSAVYHALRVLTGLDVSPTQQNESHATDEARKRFAIFTSTPSKNLLDFLHFDLGNWLTAPAPSPNEGVPVIDAISGFSIKDLRVGSGQMVQPGNLISVDYVGSLESGVVFDTTQARGQPLKYRFKNARVIPGFDLGVEGMREGGVREVTIPAKLAYGEIGIDKDIPPGATLKFTIQFIRVEP